MINRTYENYFPVYRHMDPSLDKKKDTFEDLITLVSKEQLEAKFGIHLESNDDNVINIRNMPWLDIGDLPVSYNSTKSEAFQVFVVPEDFVTDQKMVIEYSEWKGEFVLQMLPKKWEKFRFHEKGLSL